MQRASRGNAPSPWAVARQQIAVYDSMAGWLHAPAAKVVMSGVN